ncbi:hypothetical protein DFH09DRAFT_1085968 [Mycena vulgaris]|nr:hypothetical protein DFH09DRAFT_1085968 [Mycena vulgaris]
MASVLPLHITSRKAVKIAVHVFEMTQKKKEKIRFTPWSVIGGKRQRKTPCPRRRVPTRRNRTTKAARAQRRAGPATEPPVHALTGKPARAENLQREKRTRSPQKPPYSPADRVRGSKETSAGARRASGAQNATGARRQRLVLGCGRWLPRRYGVRLARRWRWARAALALPRKMTRGSGEGRGNEQAEADVREQWRRRGLEERDCKQVREARAQQRGRRERGGVPGRIRRGEGVQREGGEAKPWESEDEARHGEHATSEDGVQAEND